MHYVIPVLAAILIGTAIGALLSPRNNFLFIGSLVAIGLGAVTIFTATWTPLAIGTAVFMLTQFTQRDSAPARA